MLSPFARRKGAGRYLLEAAAEGYAEGRSRRPVVVAEEPVEGLEVILPRGADLVGRVVGLDGEDLWRLQIQAQDDDGRSYPATLDTAGRIGAPGGGSVEIPAQAPGPPLSATLPPAAQLSVQVPDLATSDVRAEVAVLGLDGSPAPILGPGGALRQAWPVVGGKTTIDDLPAGTWLVAATARDGRRWSATVTATEASRSAVILE